MYEILLSEEFERFLHDLVDASAQSHIVRRLRRAEQGNFGDTKPVARGLYEMRIHHGPGYRLYYTRVGSVVYLFLAGGDKSSQRDDIKRAAEMARTWRAG